MVVVEGNPPRWAEQTLASGRSTRRWGTDNVKWHLQSDTKSKLISMQLPFSLLLPNQSYRGWRSSHNCYSEVELLNFPIVFFYSHQHNQAQTPLISIHMYIFLMLWFCGTVWYLKIILHSNSTSYYTRFEGARGVCCVFDLISTRHSTSGCNRKKTTDRRSNWMLHTFTNGWKPHILNLCILPLTWSWIECAATVFTALCIHHYFVQLLACHVSPPTSKPHGLTVPMSTKCWTCENLWFIIILPCATSALLCFFLLFRNEEECYS